MEAANTHQVVIGIWNIDIIDKISINVIYSSPEYNLDATNFKFEAENKFLIF